MLITDYCHTLVKTYSQSPELCIDATMGNGSDTLFLCRLVGDGGKVIGFDIQQQAVDNTKRLLNEAGVESTALLALDSHVNMDKYVNEGEVDVIMFNFGYLPGGDHNLATKADTSVEAIEKGLQLLKKRGLMSLCIYSGGDSGFEEKDVILEYLRGLNPKKYIVIVHQYFNRPNNPPIPVLIIKK